MAEVRPNVAHGRRPGSSEHLAWTARRAPLHRTRTRLAALAVVLTLGTGGSAAAKPDVAVDVDTDGDGLSDFHEIHKYRTDPTRADCDGDGKPDGDWDERREFTYSIRCVVQHMPPADAVGDDWQDARVVKRGDDAVELEIVAYPLATPDVEIPDDPNWRAAAAGLTAFTKPTLTSDFDFAMTKELVSSLRNDGVDPEALGDRELVRQVSKWAFAKSRFLSMGFSTYFVTAKDGRLAVEPGLENAMADSCATTPVADDAEPPGIEATRTVEQQLDDEVRGRAMFRRRIHGSCTSSAIYLQTVLRALGVPTRTTVAMPPADGGDDAQVEMLRKGLRPSALRDAILEGPHGGWNEHTFNVVRVGGRWRRLNYAELGQPIVDRNYLGLMLRILDYDDLATSGVAATWGRKWALKSQSERYPHGNPYRLNEVSDRLGAHASVSLPPPSPVAPSADVEHTELTITAAAWVEDRVARTMPLSEEGALALTFAEAVDGETYAPYSRFAAQTDLRFVLRAEGQPDVFARYAGWTFISGRRQHMVLATTRADLKAGVAYALIPLNERGTRRWIVADGLAVSR